MPRNGSGTYALVTPGNPVVAGTVINPAHHNSTLDDIRDALTASIANDGQTPILANLPMSNFKHTGAAAATASPAGQYLLYGQSGASLAGLTLTGALNGSVRVDVASATPDLDAAASNYIRITGTTTIAAITLTNGRWRDVVFADALTLTHSASLILPGGADILTVAGDTMRVMGEAAGVVRVIFYTPSLTNRAAVATTSGTSVSIATGIPASVKRITILFNEVSTDAPGNLLIQIGDSGGLETTTYVSSGADILAAGVTVASSTAGFIINCGGTTSDIFSGHMTLTKISGTTWISSHSGKDSTTSVNSGGGSKALSGVLDRVSLTTVVGTAVFDNGSVSIFYE